MVGAVELFILIPLMWGLALLVLYWVIRMAVRHGSLDAQRIARASRERLGDQSPYRN